MKTETKDQSDRKLTHHIRKTVLGKSLQNGIIAATIGVIVSLCFVIVQFSFIQPLFQPTDFLWSLTGLASILFWACLFILSSIYSHSGGGLIDCCSILVVPSFIAYVTFLSVALSFGSPIPIWEWSFGSQFMPYIRLAVSSALLWAISLGILGFASGSAFRIANQIRTS